MAGPGFPGVRKIAPVLPLADLDPAHKLGACFFYACAVSLLQTLPLAALSIVPAAVLVMAGGQPLKPLLKRLALANLFFAFLWLFLPWGMAASGQDQNVLARFGPFVLQKSGLRLAGLITLKGNAILAAILALAGSSSPAANAQALLRLKVPAKLVTLILLTQRHLDMLAEEGRRLYQAARLRGFAPKTDLKTYRCYAWFCGLILLRAWDRAERVNAAMRLRGFYGRFTPLAPPAPPNPGLSRLVALALAWDGIILVLLDVHFR